MASNYVYLDLHQFNPDNLVVEDPAVVQYASGTSSNLSMIYYLNEEGENCDLYFAGAPSYTFGVNTEYEYKKEEIPANIKGYKLTYMLTDQSRVNNPTEDEKYTMDVFASLHQKVVEKAHEPGTIKILDEMIPAQVTLIEKARDRHLAHGGIKPLTSDGTVKGSKPPQVDPAKPKRIYVKLMTYKEKSTNTVKCRTVFNVGGRDVDPIALKDVAGTITPVFHVKSVWWGDYKKNPFAGGIQIKLSEATFVTKTFGPPRFMKSAAPTGVLPEVSEDSDSDLAADDPPDQKEMLAGVAPDGGDDEPPAASPTRQVPAISPPPAKRAPPKSRARTGGRAKKKVQTVRRS